MLSRMLPVLTLTAAMTSTGTQNAPPAPLQADLAKPGACDREGAQLVGAAPVSIRKGGPALTKVRDVRPKYPAVPSGTTVGSGPWVGEALVDVNGNVVRVWMVREVRFRPPMPSFNRAIVDAIRQWQFKPFHVKAKASPACVTVTVLINWS